VKDDDLLVTAETKEKRKARNTKKSSVKKKATASVGKK
jgi:hypothetical protein